MLKKYIKISSFLFISLFILLSNFSYAKEFRTIKDMDGIEVKIPVKIGKIANLWPAFDASIISFGVSDKLMRISPFIKDLPWGEFLAPNIIHKENIARDTSTEELLILNPDLIVTHRAESLRKVGLPAVSLSFNDYESMKKSLTIFGEILGGEYIQKMKDWCALLVDVEKYLTL